MKLLKMPTKKRLLIDFCIIIPATLIVLFCCFLFLIAKPWRHWKPAEVTVQIKQTAENPYLDPSGMTQEQRILPPAGYERVPAAENSFLAFMRQQPLYENGSMIYAYSGETLSAGNAAAVYALSVGDEGYQECADTIIRFWSEYLRSQGRTDELAFHLTNGFLCDYKSFSRGKRVLAAGEYAVWFPLSRHSDSEQTFHDWLMTVMRYAGTLSLEKESEPIAAGDAHAGDFLCHGGSPGHAVLIADEAVNAEGKRCFLLAEGFMPAQSAHILAGYAGDSNPWYTEEQLSADPIALSTYTFTGSGILRRHEGFALP
ncbi:MAG: hypothetical protein IJ060_02915 [Oscillospiraceae bacterium]|nr:hypothetical protein [Oscillospiraceae bacterium]